MCQVIKVSEMGSKGPLSLKVEQFVVSGLIRLGLPRLRRQIRKYLRVMAGYLGKRAGARSAQKKSSVGSIDGRPAMLRAGDLVRVRSREEIMGSLDENMKLGGCSFMEEMWQYCGGEYRVAKTLEYFFDEARFRMVRARDLVLLEDLHCSGNVPVFTHRCDRHCLLFWKGAWLEKVG